MVNIYNAEDGRKDTLLTVFDDHKIPIKPTMIGKFTTGPQMEIWRASRLLENQAANSPADS